MTVDDTAHSTAHLHARGHAQDTAIATSAARIVCPLGNELSSAATWSPWAKSAGRASVSFVSTSTPFPAT